MILLMPSAFRRTAYKSFMKEKELSGQESLQLITQMISRAKNDYIETGVSALLWGGIITFCALVSFFNAYLQWDVLHFVWLLTIWQTIPAHGHRRYCLLGVGHIEYIYALSLEHAVPCGCRTAGLVHSGTYPEKKIPERKEQKCLRTSTLYYTLS